MHLSSLLLLVPLVVGTSNGIVTIVTASNKRRTTTRSGITAASSPTRRLLLAHQRSKEEGRVEEEDALLGIGKMMGLARTTSILASTTTTTSPLRIRREGQGGGGFVMPMTTAAAGTIDADAAITTTISSSSIATDCHPPSSGGLLEEGKKRDRSVMKDVSTSSSPTKKKSRGGAGGSSSGSNQEGTTAKDLLPATTVGPVVLDMSRGGGGDGGGGGGDGAVVNGDVIHDHDDGSVAMSDDGFHKEAGLEGDRGVEAIQPTKKTLLLSSSTTASAAAAATTTSFSQQTRNLFRKLHGSSIPNKRKLALRVMLTVITVGFLLFTSLYTFHRGFRRTVQFWTSLGPMILEFKLLRFKSRRIDRVTDDEYKRRVRAYHDRTAPKAVDMVIRMGGIYVKIGQLLSTLGSGILDETYVKALRPLQDGLPPRDYDEISSIIEMSTGRKMEDIFVEFDEVPIGSASIAQAHRARLRRRSGSTGNGTMTTTTTTNLGSSHRRRRADDEYDDEVVVKVQYPEVAELFNADLTNLEQFTKWFMPENAELCQSLRSRHERELDFRLEASNLIEVTSNMNRHDVEPRYVRIPRVRNETGLCTQHVLVMEYLKGTSLSDAIEAEQDRVAAALGKGSGKELRDTLAKRMREHFERGGGDGKNGGGIGVGDGAVELSMGSTKAKFVQNVGPFAARIVRTYAGARNKVGDVLVGLHNVLADSVSGMSGGLVQPAIRFGSAASGDASVRKRKVDTAHVNLSKVLKTLIRVHGIQMIKDGVYNADPHSGNVLVLPDGRLGLLDYGMVGRLTRNERQTIAETVLALSRRDTAEAARLYRDSGYKVTWREGEITDDAIIHRFATFHLDKIDFTPITLENGEKRDVLQVLRSVQERRVPDWIEQARRLGGLLMGVSAQAARPISLSKEWEKIAREALCGEKGGKKTL